jgi:hypothetical protein
MKNPALVRGLLSPPHIFTVMFFSELLLINNRSEKNERISRILDSVAAFFRQRGHFVKTLPYSPM